jgi:succinyl-CoA synthetase beta subunit
MDLLEYQAKEWFRKIGIPVLPSQRIDHPTDLKRLKIPYPVVLKSQVHVGGRGLAGGVRFVENTIDAIAAAQTVFNLPILGEVPKVLLAEAKYNAERELYLAAVLDSTARRPVLLGSSQGGMDIESVLEKIQYVVVDGDFSPFYARRLALNMGLQGALMQAVSTIIEKMYQLLVQKDLDLVEINPLGVSSTGQVMALDGKVTVNDRAVGRHPEVAMLASKMTSRSPKQEISGDFGDWDGVELQGKIGILGNGAGLVLATIDLVTHGGGKPGVCLNVKQGYCSEPSTTTFGERLEKGLEILTQDKSTQVILLNLLGSVPTASEVAEVITHFVQRRDSHSGSKSRSQTNFPRLVVRLAGSDLELAKKLLASTKVTLLENLDEAVAEAVRLTKSPAGKKVTS